jgi:multiple sugar transport system ATP-binding protein
MASVTLERLAKVYPDGTHAVHSVDLEISDGEFIVLVGPSGCGKTTILRMVAGLEEITGGTIRIGDDVVNLVEPRRRDVALVFQNYALYPHMNVFENIAFPLRNQRLPKAEIKERVERITRLLGLEENLKRRPRNLSGGQRQRVAMGRAIVRQPRLFLMDEPLSNLDAKLRVQMRAEIARLQRDLGVTTIYVTHDQVEAMTMGDRIAVMRAGVLQQCGQPQELYDSPANLFVATFIGSPAMNLIRATVVRSGDGLQCAIGKQSLPLNALGGAVLGAAAAYVGRDVALGIRPEHLTDAALHPPESSSEFLVAEVSLVEALGSERLVHMELDGKPILSDEILEIARDTDAAVVETLRHEAEVGKTSIVARVDTRSRIKAGEHAEVAVRVDQLSLFDIETGRAIR